MSSPTAFAGRTRSPVGRQPFSLIRVSSISGRSSYSLRSRLTRRRVVEDVGKRPFISQALKNGCQSYSQLRRGRNRRKSRTPSPAPAPATRQPSQSIGVRFARAQLLQRRHRPLVLLGVPFPRGRVVGLGGLGQRGSLLASSAAATGTPSAGDVASPDHRTAAARHYLHGRARVRWSPPPISGISSLAFHLDGEKVDHLVQRRVIEPDRPMMSTLCSLAVSGDFLRELARHRGRSLRGCCTAAQLRRCSCRCVDVALHGRHHDAIAVAVSLRSAVAVLLFLRLDERQQVGHGLLPSPGRLHHLRQEHARAEQVTDDVHAVHPADPRSPRSAGHRQRRSLPCQLLGVVVDVGVDALHQGVRDALADQEGHATRLPLVSSRLRPC